MTPIEDIQAEAARQGLPAAEFLCGYAMALLQELGCDSVIIIHRRSDSSMRSGSNLLSLKDILTMLRAELNFLEKQSEDPQFLQKGH
jgi:hypothetical protein